MVEHYNPAENLLKTVYDQLAMRGERISLPANVISVIREEKSARKIGSLCYNEIVIVSIGDSSWIIGRGFTPRQEPHDPYNSDLLVWPREEFPENGGLLPKLVEKLRTRGDLSESLCYGTERDGLLILPKYNMSRPGGKLGERIGAILREKAPAILLKEPTYKFSFDVDTDVRKNTLTPAEYHPGAATLIFQVIAENLFNDYASQKAAEFSRKSSPERMAIELERAKNRGAAVAAAVKKRQGIESVLSA